MREWYELTSSRLVLTDLFLPGSAICDAEAAVLDNIGQNIVLQILERSLVFTSFYKR